MDLKNKLDSCIENIDTNNSYLTDIDKGRRQYYFDTYHLLLDYFVQHKGSLDENKVLLGVCMIYGWMPRIPHNVKINKDIVKLLDKAYTSSTIGTKLSKEELEFLQTSINNSLVAVSKILHFINPNVYPIWDSTIKSKFHGEFAKNSKSDIEKYLDYQMACHELKDEDIFSYFEKYKERHNQDFGELSKLRKIDMILFGEPKNQD